MTQHQPLAAIPTTGPDSPPPQDSSLTDELDTQCLSQHTPPTSPIAGMTSSVQPCGRLTGLWLLQGVSLLRQGRLSTVVSPAARALLQQPQASTVTQVPDSPGQHQPLSLVKLAARLAAVAAAARQARPSHDPSPRGSVGKVRPAASRAANFTNEAERCRRRSARYLRGLTGLWLLQEECALLAGGSSPDPRRRRAFSCSSHRPVRLRRYRIRRRRRPHW